MILICNISGLAHYAVILYVPRTGTVITIVLGLALLPKKAILGVLRLWGYYLYMCLVGGTRPARAGARISKARVRRPCECAAAARRMGFDSPRRPKHEEKMAGIRIGKKTVGVTGEALIKALKKMKTEDIGEFNRTMSAIDKYLEK
jgi:hypothetical protein